MLLGAVDRRGALEVGRRVVIFAVFVSRIFVEVLNSKAGLVLKRFCWMLMMETRIAIRKSTSDARTTSHPLYIRFQQYNKKS
jgi:hypothetical protein